MGDHPSEFDLVTCIGLEFFARRGCDIVVLEVGMGGRLDSTNVIDPPEAAVITAIGLDHTEYLGDTVEKIAAEKAGIIKAGSAAVLAAQQTSVAEVIRAHCDALGVPLAVADRPSSLRTVGRPWMESGFATGGRADPLTGGGASAQNAAAAIETALVLRERGWRIPSEAIRTGLRNACWAGRFEVLSRNPVFIVDGGHNPQGARTVADTLGTLFPGKKVSFLTRGARRQGRPRHSRSRCCPSQSGFILLPPKARAPSPPKSWPANCGRSTVSRRLPASPFRKGFAGRLPTQIPVT